jgi:hypothetical protein
LGSDAQLLGEIIEHNEVKEYDEILHHFVLALPEDRRIYEILLGVGYALELDVKPLCGTFGAYKPKKAKLQIGHEKIIYGIITSGIPFKDMSTLTKLDLEVTSSV